MSESETQLQTQRGQPPEKAFDPELFRRFIENQAQELEIRREENEIKKKELDYNYDHAKRLLEAQLKDRGEERTFTEKNNSRGGKILCFLFIVLISAILYALYINKDAIVLELIKYVGLLLAGGVGGYSIRTVQEKKEPPPKQN
jgi:hypothetical protein